MRLTSDFVVGVLVRRAQAAGAFATIARKGDATAGALFVLVDGLAGQVALYGPAPAYLADEKLPDDAALTGNRLFVLIDLGSDNTRQAAENAIAREARFDSDIWVIDIEDRAMRSFVPVIET